ncbi:rRNA maturation RNase YbeY [Candidatus Latescibacterota bacterium]
MREIDVVVGDEVSEEFPLAPDRVKSYAARLFHDYDIDRYTVNIVFIGDQYMTEINETYRKRPGTTDVLSFNLSDENLSVFEGEVYISFDRAAKQAAQWDVTIEEELIRLVTHGLLHLTGRTHQTIEEYKSLMEETERYVRGFFEGGEHT